MARKSTTGGIMVTGDRLLDQALAQFEVKVQKKAVRKATRAAAKYVQQQAIARAPVDTGALESSIKTRAKKRSRSRGIGHSVIVGKNTSFFKGDEFYAGFLEYGTQDRYHKSGKYTGRIVAESHAFLLPSLYGSKETVQRMFVKELKDVVAEFGKSQTRAKAAGMAFAGRKKSGML